MGNKEVVGDGEEVVGCVGYREVVGDGEEVVGMWVMGRRW